MMFATVGPALIYLVGGHEAIAGASPSASSSRSSSTSAASMVRPRRS